MQKRILLYLYYYKNGKKQENCGHVRLAFDGEGGCRMDVNIRRIPWEIQSLRGCFFQFGEEVCPYWEVMEAEKKHTTFLSRGSVHSPLEADDISGIFFYDGKEMEHVIAGCLGEEMDVWKLRKKEEIVEIKEELSTQNLTFPQNNVENTEDFQNSVYEYDEECLRQKQASPVSLPGEEVKTQDVCHEREEVQTQEVSHEQEEVQTQELLQEMCREPEENWQERIFKKFPKVIVRIEGEETVAVKLRPHDMVWFPGCYWRMASNQFMLNGYYHYRYLLFFKGIGTKKEKYYLGTPGEFCVNDAMTAKQYGFTDFFRTTKPQNQNMFCPAVREKFGVYCQEI